MCGIVGAVAKGNVLPVLLDGLRRLEYRGYDSAGIAAITAQGDFAHVRVLGKVNSLVNALQSRHISANIGIAHTRWATHGKPSVENAHPHICRDQIALVHNGIIENHAALRAQQIALGYKFHSNTDTEVAVNQIHIKLAMGHDLRQAVQAAIADLSGSYAFSVISRATPEQMIVARRGSPLVIGITHEGHYIASDIFALLPVTQRFIVLEEGDVAVVRRTDISIYDAEGVSVTRPEFASELRADVMSKGSYRHYMEQEIFAQPTAIYDTINTYVRNGKLEVSALDPALIKMLARSEVVQIVACGTSYHAGLIASHWIEEIAGIQCRVDIASEFRYRRPIFLPNTLCIAISQSGETADTMAAMALASELGITDSLVICNVIDSSMARAGACTLLTKAGHEIGVASTKSFTTQLVLLLLVSMLLGRRAGASASASAIESDILAALTDLPTHIEQVLAQQGQIRYMAERIADKHHALYLGRGSFLPVAMEGALKLKEISYLHAEAYAAGELKHGPLALVDEDMPVIAVAPSNDLLDKLQSNLSEVRARGGELYLFTDCRIFSATAKQQDDVHILLLKQPVPAWTAPIVYSIPLQLLAYNVAVIKGMDIDQPRNLAKSVTVA